MSQSSRAHVAVESFRIEMSFTLLYTIPSPEKPTVISLRGVVGKDTRVYWLQRDVSELFRTYPSPTTRTVLDVTGGLQHSYNTWFLTRRVVTHAQLCAEFRRCKRHRIRFLGRKLNDARTPVVLRDRHLYHQLLDPVLTLVPEATIDSIPPHQIEAFLKDLDGPVPFGVWLASFKDRVARELYG